MNEKVATKKCRTCLKSSTKTFPFTKTVTGIRPDITYAQILKDCAQLELNTAHERHLPHDLCFLCCIQLKNTYVFVQQAQQCNVKLINDSTKRFCLQEQEIDLPQLKHEVSVSIKKEIPVNHSKLDDQGECNFIANEGNNSDSEDNLITNEPLIAEPIIEYDSEDNKSFVAEPVLTTEQIIEYDFEDDEEMDNDNFTTETNQDNIEGAPLSIKIETLDSVETLLDAVQCPVCRKLIARHDKLNHMRIHDEHYEPSFCMPLAKQKPLSKEQTFKCEKRACIYINKYEYLKHIKEKPNSDQAKHLEKSLQKQDAADKKFNCQHCNHVAKTYSGLKYHSRFKHPNNYNKLKCNFCSYSTTSLKKCALLDHIKTVHIELVKNLKTNAMSNTNKNENSKTTDEEDISDNDNDQNKQEISDEDYIRNMLNMKTKASTKALVRRCEDCGIIYTNYKSFLAHRLQVHKRKDMLSICPYCDKKCKTEGGLKFHIRNTHGPEEGKQKPKPRSKEKRFMCEECSYTCTTSTLLNIHLNRHHTGKRPYKCDICSKSFVVPHDLKIHRYTHTGEKPYKCPICLKGFRDPSHRRRHKLLHTNKTPFTCDDCGKGFTQSYNLSVHKRTHLKGNKLSCSVCGKFFKNESMLNIHQINENHYDEVI